jgi:hypothetical protein
MPFGSDQRKKKLIDIGFRFGYSKDLEILFFGRFLQTVNLDSRTLDVLRGSSLVNQLDPKVYPQPGVHKSSIHLF